MIKRVSSLLLAAAVFLGLFSLSHAATRTWDGEGSTNNWSEAANWSDDATPEAADAVVFDGTSTKSSTVDAAFAGTITTLSINSGFNGILTLGRSLTMSGAISQAAGTFDAVSYDVVSSGNTTFSGGYLYMGSGTWTFNSTGNNSTNFTGCVVSAQTSTLKLVGGFVNTRTLTAAGNTFNTLQLHAGNTGTIALADNVTVEALVLSGTTNGADYGVKAASAATTITVNGDLNISGNGLNRGTFNVAGDLNLSGGMIDGATVDLTGDLNVTSGSTGNGYGRINWNKAGNETWSPAGKMCNLTVNTARTITMASTLNASGLVLTTGSAVILATYDAYFAQGNVDLAPGTFTVTSGQITIEAGYNLAHANTLTPGSNVLQDLAVKVMGSTGSTSKLAVSGDLTVQDLSIYNTVSASGGGYGFNPGANTVTVNSDLSITGGGISASGGTFNVAGNATWSAGNIDNGTFNIAGNLTRTGGTIGGGYSPTFVLNGAAAQNVTSTSTSFKHLTVSNASVSGVTFLDSSAVTGNFVDTTASSKLYFTGGTTHTWSNVNLNGQAAGTRITMASTDTNDWNFNVAALTDVSYVNPSHSNASGGIQIVADNGTNLSGGNNTNWLFPSKTVTSEAGSNGAISPLGAVTTEEGNDLQFTVTADPGYQIKSVLIDGTATSEALVSPYIYTFSGLSADHVIIASFEAEGTRTWDGGGEDNNWSTGANWTGNTSPTTWEGAVFDAASVKISTVDASFAGQVASVTVEAGYSGTITLAKNLTSGSFDLKGGAFEAGAYSITSNGSFETDGCALNAGTSTITVDTTNTNASFSGDSSTFYNVLFKSSSSAARTATLGPGTINFSGYFYVSASGTGSMIVDASANNPNVNITGVLDYTGSGSGSEYLNMGSGTWEAWGGVVLLNGYISAGTSDLRLKGNNKNIYGNSQTFYNVHVDARTTIPYISTKASDFSVANVLEVADGSRLDFDLGTTATLLKGARLVLNSTGQLYRNATSSLAVIDAGTSTIPTGGTIAVDVNYYAETQDIVVTARPYAVLRIYNTTASDHTATLGSSAGQSISADTFTINANGDGDLTVDNSVNNVDITTNKSGSYRYYYGFFGTGTGTPKIKAGSATWTIGASNVDLRNGSLEAGTSNFVFNREYSIYYQEVYSGGNSFYQITNANNNTRDSSGLIFRDSVSARTFTYTSPVSPYTTQFEPGSTAAFDNFNVSGSALSNLVFKPYGSSAAWYLNVVSQPVVSYTTPSYCDASAGAAVIANDGTSVDGGNNLNWIFDPTPEAASDFAPVSSSPVSLAYTWTINSTNEAGFRILDETDAVKVSVASRESYAAESGLSANTQYARKVQAYNGGGASTSDAVSKYTSIEAAAGATYEGVTETSITVHSSNAPSNLSSGSSGIYFENATKGTSSGWIQTNTWTSSALTANTTYNFRITTRNGDGVITATTDAGSQATQRVPTPEAPTNFNAAASSGSSFNYTWTDNSTNEAGFRVLDDANAVKATVAAGVTNASEGGLSANTQYARKVDAYNESGAATSAAVSKYTSIEASAGGTYEGVTETSVTVHSSNAPSNLSSGSSGIYFENVTKGTNSGWIQTNTWTSSALTANTTYNFRITTRNGDGIITATTDAGSQATQRVPTPEAPTNFNAAASSSSSFNYTWTDNSTSEAGFRVLDNSNVTKVAAVAGATSTSESGLLANTQYTRKVDAYNESGAVTSDAASRYTSIEASAGGTYEGVTETSVTVHSSNALSNLSSGSSGIYFENVTKGTNSGWIQTNTWTSSALTANTTYNFRITTRNGDGVITATTDAGSQATQQAPTPEAPSNFVAAPESTTGLSYAWTRNSTSEAGFRILDGVNNVRVNVVPGVTSTNESGLSANTQYARKVQAYNSTGATTSGAASKYTSIEASTGATWEGITSSSITVHSINEPSNLSAGDSGLYFENTTSGTNSGWIKTNTWTSSGLAPGTSYAFKITARNGDASVSSTLDAGSKETLSGSIPVNTPEAAAFSSVKQSRITANWTANGNPATFEYFCENETAGTNSGWTASLSWECEGLEALTEYSFRVKARASSTNESGWRDLGKATTEAYVTAEAYIAGVDLKDGDTISGTLTITVSLTREASLSSLKNGTAVLVGGVKKVYVDGVEADYEIITLTDTAVTLKLKDELSVGTHSIRIITYDSAGTEYLLERTGLKVMSGSVAATGPTLVYPNPYDPLRGDLKITYYLSVDNDISIYVFDTSGRLVWKNNYLSGTNGGKAGYNELNWNSVGLFGGLASDAYIVNVVEQGTGRLVSKTKLLIWKGGAR